MNIQPLEAGDEVRCPHCRRWHTLIHKHTAGTGTATEMLFFECRELTYFGGIAGRAGGTHHQTRKAATTSPPKRESW